MMLSQTLQARYCQTKLVDDLRFKAHIYIYLVQKMLAFFTIVSKCWIFGQYLT
jgi:hypothetical protein